MSEKKEQREGFNVEGKSDIELINQGIQVGDVNVSNQCDPLIKPTISTTPNRIKGFWFNIGNLPIDHISKEVIDKIRNKSIEEVKVLLTRCEPLRTLFTIHYPLSDEFLNECEGLLDWPILFRDKRFVNNKAWVIKYFHKINNSFNMSSIINMCNRTLLEKIIKCVGSDSFIEYYNNGCNRFPLTIGFLETILRKSINNKLMIKRVILANKGPHEYLPKEFIDKYKDKFDFSLLCYEHPTNKDYHSYRFPGCIKLENIPYYYNKEDIQKVLEWEPILTDEIFEIFKDYLDINTIFYGKRYRRVSKNIIMTHFKEIDWTKITFVVDLEIVDKVFKEVGEVNFSNNIIHDSIYSLTLDDARRYGFKNIPLTRFMFELKDISLDDIKEIKKANKLTETLLMIMLCSSIMDDQTVDFLIDDFNKSEGQLLKRPKTLTYNKDIRPYGPCTKAVRAYRTQWGADEEITWNDLLTKYDNGDNSADDIEWLFDRLNEND